MRIPFSRGVAVFWCMVLFPVMAGMCSAADSKAPGTRAQMDANVIQVDKYGVYVPKIVFYFDPAMGKQKIDSLTSAAEKLRNKKATIIYSVNGDLAADKHPLLVDIVPYREEPVALANEAPSAERVQSLPQGRPGWRTEGGEPAERNQNGQPPVAGDSSQGLSERGKPAPALARAPFPGSGRDEGGGEGVERREPIRKEEVLSFIDKCMGATVRKDTDAVLSCYADRVDYYAKGPVNRDFIRKDKGYYFRNWDSIDSAIEGAVVLIVTDQQDLKIAKFTSSFSVSNTRKSVSGRAENIWKIQRVNGDLKIVDEKQKILNN